MPSETNAVLLRSLVYCLLMVGVTMLMYLDAQIPVSKFSEISLTETAQQLIFLFLTLYFFLHARSGQQLASLAWIFCACFLVASIREMDYRLDNWFGDGAWQVLVSGVLLGMMVAISRDAEQLKRQLATFVTTPGFGLLLAGLITTVVFSRIFGYGGFWEMVMGDAYLRNVKDAVEEGTELLGDTLMLMAGVEFYFSFAYRQHSANQPAIDAAPTADFSSIPGRVATLTGSPEQLPGTRPRACPPGN